MIFHSLHTALEQPKKVTDLVLKNSGMEAIGNVPWQKFTQLIRLDLSENKLSQLPKKILRCANLRRINLANNHFLITPNWLEEMPALQYLDLSNNRLKKAPLLPSCVDTLILSVNKIKSISTVVNQCPTLLYLDISQNPIQELPSEIAVLEQLRILKASSCKLKQLPVLPIRLQILNLSKNKLNALSSNWTELTALQDLNISNNPLSINASDLASNKALLFLDLMKTKTKITISELLENTSLLASIKGGIQKKERSAAEAFFKFNTKNKLPHQYSQKALWELWLGKKTRDINNDDLKQIWQSNTYPIALRISACYFWENPTKATAVLIRDNSWEMTENRWVVFGSLFKEQLIHIHPSDDDHLIKNNPLLVSAKSQNICLNTRTIVRYLNKKNKKSFTFSRDATMIKNMQQFIGGKEGMGQAWLDYLDESGVPDLMLTPLLIRYLETVLPEEKQQISKLIFLYLPLPIQLLVDHYFEHRLTKDIYLPNITGRSLTAQLLRKLNSRNSRN